MRHTRKPRKEGLGERHSATWGKRLRTLLVVLLAGGASAQTWEAQPRGKFAQELAPAVARAQQGVAANETVRVIVQYNRTPGPEHEARAQSLGGRLNHRLGMVRSLALTIPVKALPALEADSEIASVTLDHPLKAMDDYTDAAMNVAAAVSAGYDGSGIGVAVIDSGINFNHADFWSSDGSFNRVLYHQDFTGSSEYNAQRVQVYDT